MGQGMIKPRFALTFVAGLVALPLAAGGPSDAPPDRLATASHGRSAPGFSLPAVAPPHVPDFLHNTAVAALAAFSRRDEAHGPALAYAPPMADGPAVSTESAPLPKIGEEPAAFPFAVDPSLLRDAIALYRKGDIAGADSAAQRVSDPLGRAALEWAALRLQPRPTGHRRIRDFLTTHPDWPAANWLKRRAEDALFADRHKPELIGAALERDPPTSPAGRLALARFKHASGDEAGARALVAQVWREEDLSPAFEKAALREFGAFLTKADHRFRADRLLYKENNVAGLRNAALAGKDVLLLAQARAVVNAEKPGEKEMAAVPKELRDDPGFTFALIQKARRAGRIDEAANLLLDSTRDADLLVDGDAWWTERRLVLRKLLDVGKPDLAYRLAAGHSAESAKSRIDAEFHAGWIALRFLAEGQGEPARAFVHFRRAAQAATTPISKARAFYWLGRAHAKLGQSEEARENYLKAAAHQTTFYGQLARVETGDPSLALRKPDRVPQGDERSLAVRTVALLLALGERELALPLAIEAARFSEDEAEIAAMTQLLHERRDARGGLAVAKLALQRGFPLEEYAYPIYGVPDYQALSQSAEKAMVYSIARQESAFQHDAVSHAGARGLMQMMIPTARRTAERAGLAFDERRLIADPAFNAQLGAAHLADLLDEQKGSYILVFAAYNAGGKRVRDWISAYGDPRDPGVDPIDWIERIPFTETRDYVQRIMENLQVYRHRLEAQARLSIDSDLKRTIQR